MRSGRKAIITGTFPGKLEMRLPLWSWRPLRPRWTYTSANAELALNGLLRFGTALCTSVLPRGLFSSNTSHFVTRRVTPPRVPASSRPTRSHPRPPRARATRHNAAIERCVQNRARGPPSRGAAEATPPLAAAAAAASRLCPETPRFSTLALTPSPLAGTPYIHNGQDPVQEVRQGAQENLR